MATGKFICRVCGKEYDACLSAKTVPGKYNWQEVACSPECGSIYLRRVLESRAVPTDNDVEEESLRENEEVIEENDLKGEEDFEEME